MKMTIKELSEKETEMERLIAGCNRNHCLKLIGKAYEKINYLDNLETIFKKGMSSN